MNTETLILIIIIWVALGIHSAWLLVRRVTLYFDFESSDILAIVMCVLLPIITHIATLIVFPRKGHKILWKKRV